MKRMIEPSAAKTAFAPVWPRVFRAPTGRQIIPPYGRVRVFNRDLSIEELEPLIESFPVPGRTLRRIGGYAFFSVCLVHLALWVVTLLTALIFLGIDVTESEEQNITAFIKATFSGAASLGGWVILAALVIGITGIAVDFIAWKKWGASLGGIWLRYKGRMVRTIDLPGRRKQKSDGLCRRLDSALKQMDSNSVEARLLDRAAREAIGRYIDLPVVSKDSRRVARSAVDDALVQKVREEYQAAEAAEAATLQEAEDAVLAVQAYVSEAKSAAADLETIELAKTITSKVPSRPARASRHATS
jgi:uncharacterized protein (DUF697 family)